MQKSIAPLCRPLKEHSKNLRYILIGITMHAQSMDEVQNIQTSSIHNSLIKCPIDECHSILESNIWALQRQYNQKVQEVNLKKSDLKVPF
jgi:hypothetical protein